MQIPRSSSSPTRRLPTLEWQSNGVCNYDCSYCIQSKKYRVGQPEEPDIQRFLAFFRSLPGTWEIKISGGEPFASRWLLSHTLPGLMETPHSVSLLTNLSAPKPQLDRLAQLTWGRLKVLSVSMHLEHVQAAEFIEKVLWLRPLLSPSTSLVINSVVVPGRVDALVRVQAQVREAGLKFFPQLMKTKTGVVTYAPEELDGLRRLLGEQPTHWDANLAPSYKGLRCYSGVEYFVLDQHGDAYRCRTSKRFREGYLGNVLRESIRLLSEASPCPYDICPCTVPVHRGMVVLPESGQDSRDLSGDPNAMPHSILGASALEV